MFERITEICIPPPLQHNSFNLWYDINNLCISSNKDIMKGCVVMKKYLLPYCSCFVRFHKHLHLIGILLEALIEYKLILITPQFAKMKVKQSYGLSI